MPEVLADRFGKAKHKELDKAVNKATEDFSTISAQQLLPFHWKFILACIIDTSNGELDTKFLWPGAAETLFNAHEDLRDMFLSAWELKSYSKIRNLAILAAPGSVTKPSGPISFRRMHEILSICFKGTYHGAAVDGFYEYLTRNEELFREDRYYAKFCSIVQSSGTGKSRTLIELSNKNVITIYMNLRDKDDERSFPPRDRIPSMILTRFYSEKEYMANCLAFFIALFRTVEESLSANHATSNRGESVMRWVRQMCDVSEPPESTVRNNFFTRLDANYGKARDDLIAINKERDESQEASSIPNVDKMDVDGKNNNADRTAEQFSKLFIPRPDEKHRLRPEPGLSQLLHESFLKVIRAIDTIFPKPWTGPKLVIAIDEAHPLFAPQPEYRPADVFCRVVKEYSHIVPKDHGVWVVFASTTSRVANFSPPNKIYNSCCIPLQGEEMFPPYTQLGWDQSAPFLGTVALEDVSLAKNIAGFGRPLWHSLKSTTSDPDRVLATASEKLCGTEFDPKNMDKVLAVIGQRFAINLTLGHPDSVERLENGVTSYLRICLGTTLDRTWRFTSYPSEPFLSCVAATNLHTTSLHLQTSLETLLKLVNAGMIDMGQRGELASRLLWLLAKDLFVRTRHGEAKPFLSTWDKHLLDCQMIPIVDWLEFVFGPRVWPNKEVRKTFQDAYINFSHWVCMDTNIAGSKEGDELPLNLWTLRHWQRTSAVQCFHQQDLIDKVIPIYFKGGPGSGKERMSQIFISDRVRKLGDAKLALSAITRRDRTISGEHQSDLESDSLPYIAILADLFWDPSPSSATFPEQDVNDRCLRIRAAGVDKAAYLFLADYPAVQRVLENLVHPKNMLAANRDVAMYLDAQMKFGSTANAEHMEWERGRQLPPSLA